MALSCPVTPPVWPPHYGSHFHSGSPVSHKFVGSVSFAADEEVVWLKSWIASDMKQGLIEHRSLKRSLCRNWSGEPFGFPDANSKAKKLERQPPTSTPTPTPTPTPMPQTCLGTLDAGAPARARTGGFLPTHSGLAQAPRLVRHETAPKWKSH
jgi:hypothetical protein